MKLSIIFISGWLSAQAQDGYQAPAANYQAPADNYQAPAYGNDYKTPLKCWHCDAMSFEECASKGQEETCLVSFYKEIIFTLLRC